MMRMPNAGIMVARGKWRLPAVSAAESTARRRTSMRGAMAIVHNRKGGTPRIEIARPSARDSISPGGRCSNFSARGYLTIGTRCGGSGGAELRLRVYGAW